MTSQKRSVRLSGLPNSTYIFIIVFVAASIIVPLFFTPGNISTLLTQACALMLLSTAMSVCLMMGGIDLSLGGVVSMTGVIMAMLLRGELRQAWLSLRACFPAWWWAFSTAW